MNAITHEEIRKYIEIAELAKSYKEQEMELRKDLSERVKHFAIEDHGANHSDVKFSIVLAEDIDKDFESVSLEVKTGENFRIDKKLLDEEYDGLSEEEQECFKTDWKMSDAKFKKIRDKIDSPSYNGEKDLIIFDIVTSSPGAPTLTIEID